jgi:hypothetical protein
MSDKRIVETRKYCLGKMKETAKEAEKQAQWVEYYAQNMAKYISNLREIYLRNQLTDWTMYKQWRIHLPAWARWDTSKMFQDFFRCLVRAAVTITFAFSTKMWMEIAGVLHEMSAELFSSAKAATERMMDKGGLGIWACAGKIETTTGRSPAFLQEYLQQIAAVYETIQRTFAVGKETVSLRSKYPQYIVARADDPHKQTAMNHATNSLEQIIFALSQFKNAMDIVCNYSMRHDISDQLARFLNHADLLALVQKFGNRFAASQLTNLFPLIVELVASFVSEKELATMDEIFNEMVLHISCTFLYFRSQEDENRSHLIDELAERIDHTPTKDPAAYVISGLIYRLCAIIVSSKNRLLALRAKETMDEMVKIVAARITALGEAISSAKMVTLTQKWSVISKTFAVDTTSPTANKAAKKAIQVRFKTENGWYHHVKVPAIDIIPTDLGTDQTLPMVKEIVIRAGIRNLCLEKVQQAAIEAAKHSQQTEFYTQAVTRYACQLKDVYPANGLTSWSMYKEWQQKLPPNVAQLTNSLSQALYDTLDHAVTVVAFARIIKIWTAVGCVSYWVDPGFVSSARRKAQELEKKLSARVIPSAWAVDQFNHWLQEIEAAFALVQDVFDTAKTKIIAPWKAKKLRRALPEANVHKQAAEAYATQALQYVMHALDEFKKVMDTACDDHMRCDINRRLSRFLIEGYVLYLIRGKFAKVFTASSSPVFLQLISELTRTIIDTIVLRKDRKTLALVIDKIFMYILCPFTYFWSRNESDRFHLIGEAAELINASNPLEDSEDRFVPRLVHHLIQIIATKRSTVLVSEARIAMDKIVQMMAVRTQAFNHIPLRAKGERLTKKWEEVIRVLMTDTSQTPSDKIISVKFKVREQVSYWTQVLESDTTQSNLYVNKSIKTAKIIVKSSQEAEEMRRLCLAETKRAKENTTLHANQAEAYATETNRCGSQLKGTYPVNQLTHWEIYKQWRESLPPAIRQRTDDLLQALIHSLSHTVVALAFARATKVWVEVGRLPHWEDPELVSTAKTAAETITQQASTIEKEATIRNADMQDAPSFREQLQKIGEAFAAMQETFLKAKREVITLSQAKYPHWKLPQASAHKRMAEVDAARAIQSSIFAISKFTETIHAACNLNMHCEFSICFSHFWDNLQIWKLINGKFTKASSASPWQVVPQLMGEEVNTLLTAIVAKKDKKRLGHVLDKMMRQLICHFTYFWSREEDRLRLVNELLQLMDEAAPDVDVDAIVRLTDQLIPIIPFCKHAFLVSEVKKVLDETIKMMSAYATSFQDPMLSAKGERLMQRWMEVVKTLAASIPQANGYEMNNKDDTLSEKEEGLTARCIKSVKDYFAIGTSSSHVGTTETASAVKAIKVTFMTRRWNYTVNVPATYVTQANLCVDRVTHTTIVNLQKR